MFHIVSANTATIRELRIGFRAVKRRRLKRVPL
jgi:hypothetical protein